MQYFETSSVANFSWSYFDEHAVPEWSLSSQDYASYSSYLHFDGTNWWAFDDSCFSRLHQLWRWCYWYLFQTLLLLGGLSLRSASLLGLLLRRGSLLGTSEQVNWSLSEPCWGLCSSHLLEILSCCSSWMVTVSWLVLAFSTYCRYLTRFQPKILLCLFLQLLLLAFLPWFYLLLHQSF